MLSLLYSGTRGTGWTAAALAPATDAQRRCRLIFPNFGWFDWIAISFPPADGWSAKFDRQQTMKIYRQYKAAFGCYRQFWSTIYRQIWTINRQNCRSSGIIELSAWLSPRSSAARILSIERFLSKQFSVLFPSFPLFPLFWCSVRGFFSTFSSVWKNGFYVHSSRLLF